MNTKSYCSRYCKPYTHRSDDWKGSSYISLCRDDRCERRIFAQPVGKFAPRRHHCGRLTLTPVERQEICSLLLSLRSPGVMATMLVQTASSTPDPTREPHAAMAAAVAQALRVDPA